MQVEHIQKARKSPGDCLTCGNVIEKGEPYKKLQKRFRGTLLWHRDCEVKRSQTATNKTSEYWLIREEAERQVDLAASIADILKALEGAKDAAEELSEAYGESFDNMHEGLQQGSTGEMLENNKDGCESWANELDADEEHLIRIGIRLAAHQLLESWEPEQ